MNGIPRRKMIIKLRDNISDKQHRFVLDGLVSSMWSKKYFFPMTKKDYTDNTQRANQGFMLVTALITTLSFFLAFFLLMISTK